MSRSTTGQSVLSTLQFGSRKSQTLSAIVSHCAQHIWGYTWRLSGLPGAQCVKNCLPVQAKDMGLIPGSGRSPGEGNGNPLQYSCLENSMDRGAWRATVHGIAELDTMEHTGLVDYRVSEPLTLPSHTRQAGTVWVPSSSSSDVATTGHMVGLFLTGSPKHGLLHSLESVFTLVHRHPLLPSFLRKTCLEQKS